MDYEQLKIKTYHNWDLYIHKNQFPYIGRCYAWSRRDDADKLQDMTRVERDELFDVIVPSWIKAVEELFGSIRPNFVILGNEAPHLHAHLIPRFRDTRIFDNIQFIDPRPDANYSPYPKMDLSIDFLLKIKGALRNKF